jgi:hypothetical protein
MNVNTGKINPLNLVKQSSCKRHITAADIENPDRHTHVKTLDLLTEARRQDSRYDGYG